MGQEASKVVPDLGTMVEQTTPEVMVEQAAQGAMAEQTVKGVMAEQPLLHWPRNAPMAGAIFFPSPPGGGTGLFISNDCNLILYHLGVSTAPLNHIQLLPPPLLKSIL